MLLAALVLAQSLSIIAGDENVRPVAPSFPYTANAGIDLGCDGGGPGGSSYPAKLYDPGHGEWLTYNVSRCSGGYVQATSDATHRTWDVQIGPGGELRGRDLTGARWRYDRLRAVYVNEKTRAECATPDYRAMCATPGAT